jgi:hypothetical protein
MSDFSLNRILPPLLVVALGAFVLLISAGEEPYHIDELRQVRSYTGDVGEVATASLQQEQPPLDAILNSIAQKALGVGDVRQRLLSVMFGVGTLLLTGFLLLRSGFSTLGTVSTLGVMSLTPALIGVTAYARPYALPTFLMLSFLVLAVLWLDGGRVWTIAVASVVAVLLPWSRTVEPLIFLAVSALTLGSLAWEAARRRRALWLVAVTALGLMSSIPALAVLSDHLSDRTATGGALTDRLARLGTDIPDAITAGLPYWPVVAAFLLVAVLTPRTRRVLASLWWSWVLAGVAVGFVIAFVVVAPVTQTFFGRYLFTWVIPISVLVGAVVSSTTSDGSRRSLPLGLTMGAAGLLLAWAGYITWIDLSTRSNADWKAVSEVIVDDLPTDTAIIYDAVRPLGAYRTPYAGYPRYTGDHPRIPLSLNVIGNPDVFTPGSNTAVVLLTGGARIQVPGWIGIGVDRFFTVYLPTSPRSGVEGAAEAAEEFAASLPPADGAALMLAAASLWLQSEDPERARDLVMGLLSDEDLRPEVLQAISGGPLESLVDI